MTVNEFRFPSPFRQSPGEEFAAFLDAPREQIHNPWPQTVDLDARDLGWSQPLVHLYYSPATHPVTLDRMLDQESGGIDYSLPHRVGRIHEQVHLALNGTPAKDLARLHLSTAYDAITSMIGEAQKPAAERTPLAVHMGWLEVAAAEQSLGDLANAIRIVEELIATAFSLLPVHWTPDTSEYRGNLSQLESDWVEAQIELLTSEGEAGDAELFANHYDDIRKVARLAQVHSKEAAWRTIAKLGVFLEPVVTSPENLPIAERSADRLGELADAIRHMTRFDQIDTWLSRVIAHESGLPGSEIVLWLVRHMLSESITAEALYALTLSDDGVQALNELLTSESVSVAEIVCAFYVDRVGALTSGQLPIFLYPHQQEDRWIVRPVIPGALGDSVHYLLTVESLRQQISRKYGFVCPMLGIGPNCGCATESPWFFDALHWIADEAMAGQLPPGSWGHPGPPCTYPT